MNLSMLILSGCLLLVIGSGTSYCVAMMANYKMATVCYKEGEFWDELPGILFFVIMGFNLIVFLFCGWLI